MSATYSTPQQFDTADVLSVLDGVHRPVAGLPVPWSMLANPGSATTAYGWHVTNTGCSVQGANVLTNTPGLVLLMDGTQTAASMGSDPEPAQPVLGARWTVSNGTSTSCWYRVRYFYYDEGLNNLGTSAWSSYFRVTSGADVEQSYGVDAGSVTGLKFAAMSFHVYADNSGTELTSSGRFAIYGLVAGSVSPMYIANLTGEFTTSPTTTYYDITGELAGLTLTRTAGDVSTATIVRYTGDLNPPQDQGNVISLRSRYPSAGYQMFLPVSGGTFTLQSQVIASDGTVTTQTTSALAYDCTASDVASALNALSNVSDAGTATVTGSGVIGYPFVVTLPNQQVLKVVGAPATLSPSDDNEFFRATVTEVAMSYDFTAPLGFQAQANLYASDAWQTLNAAPDPNGRTGVPHFSSDLSGPNVDYVLNGSSVAYPVTTPAATDDSTTLADQVIRLRDSVSGYAWIDTTGRLNVCDASNLSGQTTDRGTITDATYTSALEVAYDTADCVNQVSVTLCNGTAQTTYGPYDDYGSQRDNGIQSATYTLNVTTANNTESYAASYAADILASNATPALSVSALTIPLLTTTDVAFWHSVDLMDKITVTCASPSLTATCRVVGVQHTIGTDRWFLTLTLQRDGLSPAPTIRAS